MKPFCVAWTSEEIEPVLDRIRAYRFPPSCRGDGWRYGCDAGFLRRLCDYWTEVYDWRAAVIRLNRFPQFIAEVDGVALHFVHLVGEAEGRRPLLMTHGWPSSHREFWKVAESLAFPSRHGGRTEDAFDLVIPSLPNYGFSGRTDPVIDPRQVAALFNRLMKVLGYGHYHSHGGDWGAQVTAFLGLDHADQVSGLHMTMLYPYPGACPETHEEKRWAAEMRAMERALCGYAHLQSTRPQSLSWAVADSPVGQAAWIVERFHDWADLAERPFAAVFSMEDLIDTVMIYVMSGAFNSALRIYSVDTERGLDRLPDGRRVEVPVAFTWFRDPLQPRPPRSFVEKGYRVARWSEMARGGHFPAMEVPGLLVEDLRAWARGD